MIYFILTCNFNIYCFVSITTATFIESIESNKYFLALFRWVIFLDFIILAWAQILHLRKWDSLLSNNLFTTSTHRCLTTSIQTLPPLLLDTNPQLRPSHLRLCPSLHISFSFLLKFLPKWSTWPQYVKTVWY